MNLNRIEEIIKKFEELDPILVIGDIGVDKYTLGDVKRISPEAPVPVVEVYKQWHKLGLAANVVDNLASLKIQTNLCGVVGDDSAAAQLESLLEEQSIKTWGIVRESNRLTTVKERVVTSTQQIARVDFESKEELSSESYNRIMDRINEFSENHSSVILEDYGKGLFNETFTQEIINSFKSKNKFISVDPSRYSNPLIYKGANLVKPNLVESLEIAQRFGYKKNAKPIDIIQLIHEKLELETVVITMGPNGMLVYSPKYKNEPFIVPTVKSDVFDVSGAGDTAIATIAGALQSGANIEEAALIANCASGVVVGKTGTARVDQNELINFYKKNYL